MLVGLNFFISKLAANDPIYINENVSLNVLDNEYTIEFVSPYCEERIITLESEQNTENYSKIVYGKDAESISLLYDKHDDAVEDIGEIYDYIEGEGVPNIPFITLNLQIPQDAKYSVKLKEIQYIDIRTGEISSSPKICNLSYAYLPCQEFSATEEVFKNQFDFKEYSKEQFNELYTISEPFSAMGTYGFTFNIFPFIYLPVKQSIIAVYRVKYVISVDANISLIQMMEEELSSEQMATSGAYMYDNYLGTTKMDATTTSKGKFLIITTNDDYANALTPYITHKRNYGYDVFLHVQDGGYSSATILRNYIKAMYDNTSTRPQYVLLVGNYSDIPVSYGTIDDDSNPPTDIYYACLEKAAIGKETNFYPEVYIGRWPVISTSEISKIVNKVINYEQTNIRSRLFDLYSGTGSYHTIFESDNKKVADKLATMSHVSVRNFKGSSGVNDSVMRYNLSHSIVRMLIYNGHGSATGLGVPYHNINTYAIDTIASTPYFMIAFACLLNKPTYTAFGPVWTVDGDKTLAFYGSTVTTTTSSDTYLCKHIFDYFKSQAANIRYSQITQYAAGKYYNALKNPTRKKETKKYLFLGDPTAFIFGMDISNGNPMAYAKPTNKDNEEVILCKLNDTEMIKIVNLYDIEGKLIFTKHNNVLNTSVIEEMLKSLRKGVYIVSVETTENHYVKKVIL